MTTPAKATFRTEFPDFDPATMPAIPATWEDRSWHNDACPAFDAGNDIIVFIDFADPADREWPDMQRFGVVRRDPVTGDDTEILRTDSWEEVLAVLAPITTTTFSFVVKSLHRDLFRVVVKATDEKQGWVAFWQWCESNGITRKEWVRDVYEARIVPNLRNV